MTINNKLKYKKSNLIFFFYLTSILNLLVVVIIKIKMDLKEKFSNNNILEEAAVIPCLSDKIFIQNNLL